MKVGIIYEAEDYYEDKKKEKLLKQLHTRTVNNLKHLLFNLTKQTISEKR